MNLYGSAWIFIFRPRVSELGMYQNFDGTQIIYLLTKRYPKIDYTTNARKWKYSRKTHASGENIWTKGLFGLKGYFEIE